MSFLAQTSTTTTGVNFPNLVCTCLVWSALLLALVVLVMRDETREQRARIKSLGVAGASIALFFAVWAVESQVADVALGTGGRPGGDLVEQHSWLAAFPITSSYHLDADGLGLAVILLTAVVFFCAMLAAWRNEQRVKLLTVCLLILETASLGVLTAYDWVLFLLFWTLPIAPIYLLVRGFGQGEQSRAAARYAAGALLSTALLAVAAVLIAFQSGALSFDMGTTPVSLPKADDVVAFWLIASASLLAMAIVPLHGALLDLEEDSTGVLSAVFAAVLPSIGAYALIHVAVGFFPSLAGSYSLFFAGLAVVAVVWSGLAALRTDDLRRLIGHVGTMLMGLVLLAVAGHTTVALTGVMFLLVARGLGVAVLMLLASGLQERTRRVRISQLGRLAWQAPYLSAFWLVASLTVAGLPLLAGFTGDLLVFTGSFPAHRWATAAVLGGSIMAGGVLVWTTQRIFLGSSRDTFVRVRDLGPLEITYLGLLVGVILLFGILPGHFGGLFQNGAEFILFPAAS